MRCKLAFILQRTDSTATIANAVAYDLEAMKMPVSVPKEFVEKWRSESGDKMRLAAEQQYSSLKGLYDHRLKRGRHASESAAEAASETSRPPSGLVSGE